MAPFIIATYVLVPRLERMRDVLQHKLMPEYDDAIILDYVSPVPQDRAFKQSVMQGQPGAFYANEFRELAGLEPEDELDEVLMAPATPGEADPDEADDEEGGKPPKKPAEADDLSEEEKRQLDRLLFKMAKVAR
jgi:hypothetical protein